jgi:hypothetical protein
VGTIWTAAVSMKSFEGSSSVNNAPAGRSAATINIKAAGSVRRIIYPA